MAYKFTLSTVTDYAKDIDAIEEFYQNDLIFHKIKRDENITLSAVELKGPKKPKMTLVIIPGRAEIEHKYAELLYNLKRRSIRVLVLFVRGQGSSTRLIKNSPKCHLTRFEYYTEDVSFMLETLGVTEFVMMGFSLGGLICLDYLKNAPLKPKKLALLAPYLWPYVKVPDSVLKTFVHSLGKMPLFNTAYTSHGKEYKKVEFKDNIHSHDQFRYERYHLYYQQHPELALGGPTFSFVSEATRKQEELMKSNFDFTTPVLCICAGDDQVVSTAHCINFMRKHEKDIIPPVVISIPHAYHDLLNEDDAYRQVALNKALDFLVFGAN